MRNDAARPWDRQPGETGKHFGWFVEYLNLGPDRSLDKAYKRAHPQTTLKRRSKPWARASARWNWPERVAAYDADVQREKDRAHRAAQTAATERHVRELVALQNAALIPTRVILEIVGTSSAMADLRSRALASTDGFVSVLRLARELSASVPDLIKMERLSLNLSSDRLEVAEPDLSLARRISADPAAVDLCIALFDQIAGSSEPPDVNTIAADKAAFGS